MLWFFCFFLFCVWYFVPGLFLLLFLFCFILFLFCLGFFNLKYKYVWMVRTHSTTMITTLMVSATVVAGYVHVSRTPIYIYIPITYASDSRIKNYRSSRWQFSHTQCLWWWIMEEITTLPLEPIWLLWCNLYHGATSRSCYCCKRRKEMFYLTTHSTHFIYGYMASDIW